MSGERFGKLTVIERDGNIGPAAAWKCRCDCGSELTTTGNRLRRGKVQSCGCISIELRSEKRRTHGKTHDRTYTSWQMMRNRCLNPDAENYSYYGGRGITICARWDSFENFLADMGERPPNKTLDREDTNGNYEPDNCRWATPVQQAQNRRPRS
ncbi:hypothetical protein [Methylobacterium sp. AMS5]|uniref:hypothetical protein n=1 Tax=Methylobacterium sp. AMS5 TaxID=925818 RepID=UPI0011874578|nr:hypothetical protein [Methylobacterium sp. AMS5]